MLVSLIYLSAHEALGVVMCVLSLVLPRCVLYGVDREYFVSHVWVGRGRWPTYPVDMYSIAHFCFFIFPSVRNTATRNVIIFQCVSVGGLQSKFFVVFFADNCVHTMGRHRSRSVSRGRRRADSGGPRSAGGRALRLKSESDSSAERRRRKRDSKRRQASRSSSGEERSRHRTKVKKEKKRSKKKKRRRSSESSDEATDTDSIRYHTT